MLEEGTSYPRWILHLRQEAVLEMEARHRQYCSLAGTEAVVHECVVFGLRVESLR